MVILVRGEGIAVNLHARGSLGDVAMLDFVQTEDSPGRRVELVMVDLEVGEGRVESKLGV